MKKSDLIIEGPKTSKKIFILAHGAGAPMDSDWMNDLSKLLVNEKIKVVRFEFPYMNERRLTGKKRPPNTKKILFETWEEVIKLVAPSEKVFIGGKSMGGRMASMIADELKVKGLICLGFPFHAPGKDPKERILHLEKLKTSSLILQGTRDSMGTEEEVKTYKLSKKIKISWLPDGDHNLKPRKKSGYSLEDHLLTASKKISNFMV